MRFPRWLHRWYANAFGYFWLPCPICREPFGGHEMTDATLMDTPNTGRGVCPGCWEEARRLNTERGFPAWRKV
mgnify:CR=1 FL=1